MSTASSRRSGTCAAALADGLVEGRPITYRGSVTSTKLKVSGIDVFSAGDFSGGDGDARTSSCATPAAASTSASIVAGQSHRRRRPLRRYRRRQLVFRPAQEGRGCRGNARLSDLRSGLRLGRRRWRTLRRPLRRSRTMPRFCGCNGVSKGQVVSCIAQGAHSLDAVRAELQGIGKLRLLHRPRRESARADARRRCSRRGAEDDVQVHQLHAMTTCVARSWRRG